MKKLTDEIGKYSEMILMERKVREETQNTLFRMIEDMESNLSREIEIEKRDREENEETFIGLIETTCARIERNIG
jgi:hypothetical protein